MHGELLEQEIHEQPAALQRIIEQEDAHVRTITADLRGRFDYVIIAARGTSDNAARYAQYLLGVHNHLPVALATPSLFTLYRQPPVLKRALVMGISQSGQSPDIVSVLEEARQQGCPTLAITNNQKSPLAGIADHVIELHAGPERAVAATKTYTTSLAALALFAVHLSENRDSLDQLYQMPDLARQTLAHLSALPPRVERYRYMEHCVVIGRGFNYATAFEISLKIKELTRVVAEPYSSADFLHGPIALAVEGFPAIVVAPSGAILDDLRALIARLTERRAELLLISDDTSLLNQAHLPMPLPEGVPEWLSPLIAVKPGQVFALALAQARGLDPDRPEGLTKVTETW